MQCTANIYSRNWDAHKKCTSYKYLPYTLQCRSIDVTVNQCKSVFTFFYLTWGAVIKCKLYSGITVESGTHVKSVKITLNTFAVCPKFLSLKIYDLEL